MYHITIANHIFDRFVFVRIYFRERACPEHFISARTLYFRILHPVLSAGVSPFPLCMRSGFALKHPEISEMVYVASEKTFHCHIKGILVEKASLISLFHRIYE